MGWKILLQSFGSVGQMVLAALAQVRDQICKKFVQLGMIFVIHYAPTSCPLPMIRCP